jgi:DNA-binding response OmpR family regulator
MAPIILIVDDERDFCFIITTYFKKKKYQVAVAHTLAEGLRLAKEINPAILFLDNNLPDGDGWDAVWRFVEIIPQIKVYLISAHRDKTSFPQHPENISILEKPISLAFLDSIVTP